MLYRKKRLIALITIVAALTLTACDFSQLPLGPGNSTTAQQQGGPNNPSKPGDNAACSEILRNVLTDVDYQILIEKDHVTQNNTQFSETSNKYKAIPYGFLEDKGYNVEKIKENELSCETNVYRINNDLFIAMRVETEASKNYLTNYVLKYSLTNQEVEDLNAVAVSFEPLYKCTSYQAPFFIQEMSYHKDPEILSTAYATQQTINAYESNLYKERSKYFNVYYLGNEHGDSLSDDHMFEVFYKDPNKTDIVYKTQKQIIKIARAKSYTYAIDGVRVYDDQQSKFIVGTPYRPEDIIIYNLQNACHRQFSSDFIRNELLK